VLQAQRAVLISEPADSGHGSRLIQLHIAVVLDVILQPRGNAGAASAGRIPSRCGIVVSVFFRVTIVFGVPVSSSLGTFTATGFPEKKRKRKRNSKTDVSSFSRTDGAKQGADREQENRNFFHRAATLMPKLAHPGQKGSSREPASLTQGRKDKNVHNEAAKATKRNFSSRIFAAFEASL
jgi:hypothetical protein